MKFLRDRKNLVILLLSILFFIRVPKEDVRFLFWVLTGVSLCAFLDFMINNLFFKKIILPKSALISGFIVAGILDFRQPWLVLAVFSILAVLSKHMIKFKGSHIFNPANFALFLATLFKIPLTWKIESNIYLIILFGIYIAYSLKKIPHILGFLVFFAALFATQRINPFLLISWFFVFIMLIEPKTSGYGYLKGFLFGSIAGIGSFLVFKFFPGYDFFVSSLAIANFSRVFLEKIKR